ncbi:uncharacterized protein LOC143200041 [Rhynchophorus ferrugineus]|uniref:uncharacterized protein LOC143200041 n=1 Tax=Rhynchophorus ferrugineus TaxID=354439 RepID=UPI003FCC61CB
MYNIVIFYVTVFIFSICTAVNDYSYLINTTQCTIPNLPAFYHSWNNYTPSYPISCSSFEPVSYITVERDVVTLHIRTEVIQKQFGNSDDNTCCYSVISRHGSVDYPDVGYVFSSYCRSFKNSARLYDDTVVVLCHNSTEDTTNGYPSNFWYSNIHQVVRRTPNLVRKAELLKESSRKKPISVLIVVIDAVSRLNFIRTMPKTRDFVTQNGFHEFRGYNKIDDNTFPNAMAFFSGMNQNQSVDICQPWTLDGLNNCPLIWYDYRDLGYITAYAEDWSDIATFNYLKKGFKVPPTDYYFKPYMDSLRFLRTEIQDGMPFCAGPESQGDRMLNLAFDFAKNMKGLPSFGVFWMNTFSHNVITTPKTMDDKVKQLFQRLKSVGVLDESVVILISDHGIRFGEILNTTRGYYEVRLPMNYISLPHWFKERYPDETRNFLDNTKVLTSTYDMYMTLQDLLVLSGTDYKVKSSRACPKCKSIFAKIPNERSCSDAGISNKWCTCNLDLDMDK